MSRITTLILAGTAFILLAGCANIDARREQRWAAFEPLRPDPEFRILPDRPLLEQLLRRVGRVADGRARR